MLPPDVSFVTQEDALRAMHPAVLSRAGEKVLPRLDRHARAILSLSPFVVLASQGPRGADVSPRGDPPGFVRVIDDEHVLMPDRVGNNRFDSFANVLRDPKVGLLVLVPGMGEALRINGSARVTDDARLLVDSAVNGRAPRIGLLISVEEVFLHCAKAVTRAGLWDPSRYIDRSALPSYSDMLVDQIASLTREESEWQGAEMARRGLY